MRIRKRAAAATLLCAATGAAAAWGEWAHWRAAALLVDPELAGQGRGGSEAILCLGYRNRARGRANAANRWRVRAALRSVDPAATHSRVLFCGGNVPGAPSEAALMAAYAVHECGFGGEVELEEKSRTTWENIERAVPLIGDVDRVKIVSHSLHALKARMYLHRQAPELARRLVPARDYRFGEQILLKPLLAAYGIGKLRRARRSAAGGFR